jgi:hypothetical protein
MYQMHRIFCATPWELEGERFAFYDIVGEFNERKAMQRGILFVPVALTSVRDKRPYQFDVENNIRACRHYILLVSEDWGPAARNFQNDYHLALQCAADPALPMHSIAVLAKKQPSGPPLAAGMPDPMATFATPGEFDECMTSLLADWLESLAPTDVPADASASSAAAQ